MNTIIKDDQGLDTALMMEGYSQEQRIEAKQTIRTQFRDTAISVFQDILGKELPESITVNMVISTGEELKGEDAARLASFNAELSRAGRSVFNIYEVTVKTILNHSDSMSLRKIIIHEMFHAADLCMLKNSHRFFEELQKKIYGEGDIFSRTEQNADIALMKTLQMLCHYRAEGIAILGESLLTESRFCTAANATAQFCSVFNLMMMRAQMVGCGHREESDGFYKNAFHEAYAVAPIILLLVLKKRGNIAPELARKALEGLDSGQYGLADCEIQSIMRSALDLTLAEYIQGLITLGDEVAPIRPFLNFCAMLQREYDEDNMKAYEQLLRQPESEASFGKAMSQIMGCCMSEAELDRMFRDFMEAVSDEHLFPQMKQNVSILYDTLKNDQDAERRKIAQWALTYLFDDEDIIHDDIPGIGFVDDMTIAAYAMNLLNREH